MKNLIARQRWACQPPRSPDLDVLDLGLFNAIQKAQLRQDATCISGLINAVVGILSNGLSR
ncbi:TPA: hypothetical protein N0F65_001976 [Lagenidium giganteum]|uniref:Uncharacterized protein n=1 Tax=Lagenidium giganteum TaxID=4803 RepID=A0AAV2YPU7_9STRA|nr:TPA: hypothetical protein N0F65_001976 [Lagenidium giganteum]